MAIRASSAGPGGSCRPPPTLPDRRAPAPPRARGRTVGSMGVGDGNGWVRCRCGLRHWGVFGASGLLLARPAPDGTPGLEVLLQLRAAWTHQGGTWGIPGGATDSHEDPLTGALRETREETGVDPDAVEVLGLVVGADHGDWIYRVCLLYTSPSPRDGLLSRMPS